MYSQNEQRRGQHTCNVIKIQDVYSLDIEKRGSIDVINKVMLLKFKGALLSNSYSFI